MSVSDINPFLVDPDATPVHSPVNVNKEVPPPPVLTDTDESDEEDIPDLYLPGLILPTMFMPIPDTDPISTLLNKHVSPELRPDRDVTGEWTHADFETLVATNSWRALATMARDKITSTATPSTPHLAGILSLWSLRLTSLARLRLFNQCSAECTNLFSVLNGIEPAEHRQWIFEVLVPWEIEVMKSRLPYWRGDHLRYLDELSDLLRRCKSGIRNADAHSKPMWKERAARIALITASQFIEMKDYTSAANLLLPLVKTSPTAQLHAAIARVHLQSGNIPEARHHFSAASSLSTVPNAHNVAMEASAEGDWPAVEQTLKDHLRKEADDLRSVNNLSVALLSQGKLKEGIELLETALQVAPSKLVTAEPFLFNLSTLYELRSATSVTKKRDLLIEVAKWSGDGLKTSSLKMAAA